ncbi:DUF1493 family protein [Paraburkholderia caribensis]|uniref:DUF1493 family protein n=1 Tax=Paraburkholderia caribensis TaxID=75105 RepID=UPI001CC4806B|nr:DUF1493 family protein [Paraburkholderia caribensis]
MSEAKGPPLRGLFRFARQRSAEHHSLGRRLQAWVVRHTFDRFKISMSMTPQSAVSVELEEFLREQVGLHAIDKVNPADRLEDDLHITGDDAADLIEAFVTRFNIKNGDFIFQRYFDEEGYDLFFLLKRRFRKKTLKIEKEPLTVSMLQRAIDLGLWDSQLVRE